jgi:hypothetical protein
MPDESKKPRAIEQKFGKELVEAGWTAVPNMLFEHMTALGIDSTDVVIVIHLLRYWWERETLPHPSKVTIAHAMGIHPRTVQRRIASLEHARLIGREQRRNLHKKSSTNIYHLDGLLEALKPYAVEEVQARDLARATRLQRLKRKKPVKLTVV